MKKIISIGCSIAASATLASGVKISERFGYDPVDSTRFLQAALDSSEKELVLDKRDAPWIASPLLCTNGNKTIRIEDGAWLMAKRGEFHRNIDSLLVFRQCRGVKLVGAGAEKCGLKMWRDDYANTNLYRHSEHRMGISLLSCEDALIEGITVSETGGDGLYISNTGRNTPPCRNVVVRNCVFDRNYRQGISVISVDGLLMENVVMSNTKGTPPMAGVDFEPNSSGEVMSRIVVRNCLALNNVGSGFEIVPHYFNSESGKTSILFENCRSVGNLGCAWSYLAAFKRRSGYDAEIPYRECDITLRNCTMAECGLSGVSIHTRPLSSGSFVMENCLIDGCGTNEAAKADVAVTVTGHDGYEPFEVAFKDLAIRQRKARTWIDIGNKARLFRGEPTRISGNVKVADGGKSVTHMLDDAWRNRNTPFTPCERKEIVRRVKADLSDVEVVDSAIGNAVECAPVFVRTASRNRFRTLYVLHARKGQEVAVDFLVKAFAGNKPKCAFQAGRYGVKDSVVCQKSSSREKVPLRFTVPETGFYAIRMRTRCPVAVTSFNVPLAIDVTDGVVGVTGVKDPFKGRKGFKGAKLHVNVPQDAKAFTAAYFGDGREALNARFLDPDGNVVCEFEPMIGLRYARVDGPKSGLWTLQLDAPQKHKFENHRLSLNGVPGWYFLSPEKMWR